MQALKVVCLTVAIAFGSLFAQEFRGTIGGTVTDSTGAVVPEVTIVITNINTTVAVTTVTASNGTYTVPFLIPGPYKVTAEAEGFKTSVRDGIDVQVQDRLRIDLALEVGAVTEYVEVTAEAPLLEAGRHHQRDGEIRHQRDPRLGARFLAQ